MAFASHATASNTPMYPDNPRPLGAYVELVRTEEIVFSYKALILTVRCSCKIIISQNEKAVGGGGGGTLGGSSGHTIISNGGGGGRRGSGGRDGGVCVAISSMAVLVILLVVLVVLSTVDPARHAPIA